MITRNPAVVGVTFALLCASCSTEQFLVKSANPGSVSKLASGGLTLRAEANAWNLAPADLNAYLTPIWVRISNAHAAAIRIAYSDFALTDESGGRYAVISPYNGEVGSFADPARAASSKAPFVPSTLSRSDYVTFGETHSTALDAGFESSFAPWPYFYYGPAYYGPNTYCWDERFYPAPPSEDVIRTGLPQGVLEEGGRISGFLYFQNAGKRETHLTFTWTAHTTDGQIIDHAAIPLNVVKFEGRE